MLYLFIFYLWFLFSNKAQLKHEEQDHLWRSDKSHIQGRE